MVVARLTKVTLRAPRDEAGRLIAGLLRFGRFHPSSREGLVQDTQLLLLGSRGQELYGRARQLLDHPNLQGAPPDRPSPTGYRSTDVVATLRQLEEDLETIERNLPLVADVADRTSVATLLRTIRDAGLDVFHALQRLLVLPTGDGSVTMEGFVPTAQLEEFRKVLGPYVVSAHPVLVRMKDDPYVPTLLVNPRAIALFERFTLQRGIPKYNEVDPTPIVAFVFPLFFGIMFGDLGHGLALASFGLFLWSRTKYEYWGQLIVVFGVAAGIFGFLRGVFFGVPFTTPVHAYLSLPPALNASLTFSYVPLLLEVAVLVGTFHLASAYVIAIVNQVRSRRPADALLGALPTLLLYASLVAFALAVLATGLRPATVFVSRASVPFFRQFLDLSVPVFLIAWATAPIIVGSLVVLVVAPPVRRYLASRSLRKTFRSLRESLLDALSRPFEFALNTLSYIRLAALLITNTLLSSLIARALDYGIPGLVLAALLNILLMAMEGLIVYLQDMRLHSLEWLSKFYSGTGTAFDPVRSRSGIFAPLAT